MSENFFLNWVSTRIGLSLNRDFPKLSQHSDSILDSVNIFVVNVNIICNNSVKVGGVFAPI
jgi:hypothetical protein